MIIKSEVAKFVRPNGAAEGANGMKISNGFYEAMNQKVKGLIEQAMLRAKQNGRNTLQEQDA